jgi:hypothetical protein
MDGTEHQRITLVEHQTASNAAPHGAARGWITLVTLIRGAYNPSSPQSTNPSVFLSGSKFSFR